MTLPFRNINWILLGISAILELITIYFVIKMLGTHCVKGGEYATTVWSHIYFLPGITAQALTLTLFRFVCRTVGLDPIAVTFNVASGILLIITSLILLLSMISHCGNEFADCFYVSGSCGLIAGIIHLLNGVMCLIYIPHEEAPYIKPIRRSTKAFL